MMIISTNTISICNRYADTTASTRSLTQHCHCLYSRSSFHIASQVGALTSCAQSLFSLPRSRMIRITAVTKLDVSTLAYSDHKTCRKNVLISVSDKEGIDFLGRGLQELGYTIVSTGGTARSLEQAGISVTRVEEITHVPEMLDGRVKTLHPNIYCAILARRDDDNHMNALNKHGIGTIDIVVVNLYPFVEKVTSSSGVTSEDAIDSIDIGGPTLISAAAKNSKDVLVIVDPKDYSSVLEFLQGKENNEEFREKLALKASQYLSIYSSLVTQWRQNCFFEGSKFPSSLILPLTFKSTLRYGENPHQEAAFYEDKSLSLVNAGAIGNVIQHHGKEMSYNNYLDADAAWNCVCEFQSPTCVIVKHTNPCGIASRDDMLEAYRLAVKADPISAFGGVVAVNTTINEDLAREIREFRSPIDGKIMFHEIIIAPSYTEKGLEILRGKSKNLRILEAKRTQKGKLLKQVLGGWLVQYSDDLIPEDIEFTVMSDRLPQANEMSDAQFAWLCVKHVKSNAVVIAKNRCMLGMGSGQPNRLESLRIAFRKAGDEARGAVLASDAFFPFAWNDAVEEACQNGIAVIAEPGGSIRDGDAVNCCNQYGVSLLFTNVRHFRH